MRTLRAGDLVLEPQVAAHAAELFPVLDDPGLYDFIDDEGPASETALRERLARLESRRSPDGSEAWLNWVVRNAEGRVVGYVQATVGPKHEAEIAYVLGRRDSFFTFLSSILLSRVFSGSGERAYPALAGFKSLRQPPEQIRSRTCKKAQWQNRDSNSCPYRQKNNPGSSLDFSRSYYRSMGIRHQRRGLEMMVVI